MPPKRKAQDDSATPKRVTRRRKQPIPDNESDELNLSSAKPQADPPATPGPRPGAPRAVMECVEIVTSTPGSDGRTLGGHVSRLKAIPPQRTPSTPSRQLRSGSISPPKPLPSTPLWARPPLTLHVSPSKPRSDDVPNIPSKPTSCPSSPRKAGSALTSPVKLPGVLPPYLVPYLRLQKRAILGALQSGSPSSEDLDDHDHLSTNSTAYAQLYELLHGTTSRGEGNSCLLLGPRGSGKSSLVERAIKDLSGEPIIIRLSGHTQHNDRLALREIARQLSQQTGKSFLHETEEDVQEEPNPFIDPGPSISIPPPSHLPALISVLPTLSRPTVIVLDAFDLFAHHPRQSLLYCLLDTVQSCKVGQGNNGITVIGVTTRIDTINLLEKRVKSRFSGRMIRTAPPSDVLSWINVSRRLLNTLADGSSEWSPLWSSAVQSFLEDRKVVDTMRDTFSLTRDIRMLKQILTAVVINLRPTSPFPTVSHLSAAVSAQRLRQKFCNLQALPYPSMCLLVAAMHAHSVGHDIITFEMLYDAFREEFRVSSAAPIHIEGGSIGMARCSREVLMRSFEELVGARMFTSVAAPSVTVSPEFVRYRCVVEQGAVKQAVTAMGQTNLKKWFSKAQM